jgi:hypothetical protein
MTGDCGRLDGTVGVFAGVFAGVFSLCRFSVPVEGVGYDNSLQVDFDSGPNTSRGVSSLQDDVSPGGDGVFGADGVRGKV